MKKDRVERLEDILILGVALLLPLHGYLSISNFVNGIDKGYGHSYPPHAYVLIGAYLLIVFAIDGFLLWRRSFDPAEVLRKYWGSAFGATVLVLALRSAAPGAWDGLKVLCLLYTPYVVLAPLLEGLGTAVERSAAVQIGLLGGFCLLQWAVCKFSVDRKRT